MRQLLDLGVKRVIIGSLCVKEPETTRAILEECGADRIVLAFDVRGDFEKGFYVATHGWQETSQHKIEDMLTRYNGVAEHILCTDISKDGKLQGPNAALYKHLVQTASQFKFQASGGVAELKDIDELKETGVAAAIIGKALYEHKFTLCDALQRVR